MFRLALLRISVRPVTNFLIAAILFFVFAGLSYAQTAEPIIDTRLPLNLDNPATWAVVGAKTFTPGQIRMALRHDWRIALTECPDEYSFVRDVYTKILQTKIKAGYCLAGFRDAQIVVKLYDKEAALMPMDGKKRRKKDGFTELDDRIRYNPKAAPPILSNPHIQINIKEGKRYRQGEIHVLGNYEIDKKAIVDAIKAPGYSSMAGQTTGFLTTITDVGLMKWRAGFRDYNSDPQGPAWQVGKPCPLNGIGQLADAAKPIMKRRISATLAAQGYFESNFTFYLTADKSNETVDLNIEIISLGPKAKLGKIELIGLKRHSEKKVLNFLELKIGESIDQARMLELADRLFQSGRFVDFQIEISPMPNQWPLSVLRIEVLEHKTIPLLSEPLLREAEVLLQVARQLEPTGNKQSDLVVSVGGRSGELARLVLSNRNGMALAVSQPGKESAGTDTLLDRSPFSFAAVFQQEIWTYYSFDRNIHCRFPLGFPQLILTSEVKIQEDRNAVTSNPAPDKSEKNQSNQPDGKASPYTDVFTLGAGAIATPTEKLPIRHLVAYEPCVILDLIYRRRDPAISFKLIEGKTYHQLVGNYGDNCRFILKIDAASGKLIRFKMETSDAAEPTGDSDLDEVDSDVLLAKAIFGELPQSVEIRYKKGGYERLLTQIEKAAASSRERYKPGRPITSFAETFINEPWMRRLAEFNRIESERFDGIRDSCLHGWSPVLDTALVELTKFFDFMEMESDKFVIPPEQDCPGVTELSGLNWLQYVRSPWFWTIMMYTRADDLVPRESWPWQISQAYALLSFGGSRQGVAVLVRMTNDSKTGPLAFLALALLLKDPQPEISRHLATLGLQRIDNEHFQADCQPLVDSRGSVGRLMLKLMAVLKTMREEELEYFIVELPEAYRKPLRLMAEELRRDTDRSPEEAAIAALTAAWHGELQKVVERQLEQIRDMNTPPSTDPIK